MREFNLPSGYNELGIEYRLSSIADAYIVRSLLTKS